MIAIRCDAGPATDQSPQKVTIVIDEKGRIHEVWLGWERANLPDVDLGPILGITREEYLLQCRIACGEA